VKNHAVVIGCFGDAYKKLSETTYPSIRQYAQKIGADLIELPSRKYPAFNVSYEKLQISEVLGSYKRAIWFDTDLIIRDDTPSLFDIVPEGLFGALDEISVQGQNPDYIRTMLGACADLKCPPVPEPKKYFNAGVLVLDKSHADMVKIPPVFVGDHFMDQSYLNVRSFQLGKDFFNLTQKFNHMWICKGDRLSSHIIHYANTICGGGWMPFAPKGGTYLDLIRQDLRIWRERLK
jgi:alpha-N-acetylglucosamine transferase